MATCDFCDKSNVKETAGNGYIMYECKGCGYVDIWDLYPYEYPDGLQEDEHAPQHR